MLPRVGLKSLLLDNFDYQILYPDMHLVLPESGGSPLASREPKDPESCGSVRSTSATLPFGQCPPITSLTGTTYATAQVLVQQSSYVLSDKIFSYSPESFDLDVAVKSWQHDKCKNGFGFQTRLQSMQLRAGAGSVALGYMFSPDFDLAKRHVPQTIIASSHALTELRPALDELSLLYNVSNPVVAQIAAVDYNPKTSPGLVTDYITAQMTAEDLGLALICSTSVFESQRMSLLASVLAQDMPSMHTYDGVGVGSETTKVADVIGPDELFDTYQSILRRVTKDKQKHLDQEGKAANALKAFNQELGTDYQPFEYYGHPKAEAILVVFGSVEASLAAQLACASSKYNNDKVGAINVRLYRPFLEDDFLNALPRTVKRIVVLGQVENEATMIDPTQRSRLYTDVLAALTFSARFPNLSLTDGKYLPEEVWTPEKMLSQFQKMGEKTVDSDICRGLYSDILGSTIQQYSFWDTDDSANAEVAPEIASVLSKSPNENIALRARHDNLVRGGVMRADVRTSAKAIEAPYSVTSAKIAFVCDEKLLEDFAILDSVQRCGALVLKLPNSKDQDSEKFDKRLPAIVRRQIADKSLHLFVFDPTASPRVAEDPKLESLLLRLGLLRLAQDDFVISASKLRLTYDQNATKQLLTDLDVAFWRIEVPETWKGVESSLQTEPLPRDIFSNSFVSFDKREDEQPTYLKSWVTAAKGLSFKEATGTRTALRPDVPAKTFTVRVKEHRRLTPKTYDRNIFHIEFDLGGSGLSYNIGEALGIHAENNRNEVEEFIKWYGLNPEDVVEVPLHETPGILEKRTVYQSLMQNLDIFGRPPKRFYEMLADFASNDNERKQLLALGGPEGAVEFKRRAEVDTVTYADILLEFPSAHPSFHDIVRIVSPMKRREYSIASSQKVQPNSVSLLIVTVEWVDPRGRDRFGQATRYLDNLNVGDPVTVSVKPSVMKLPQKTNAPLLMAGLGTGLAPFRAFVQERAWQKQQGYEVGSVLLYMGSRHQREEYLYGEEWEAYQDAGIITLLGRAFSRDQPHKVYIQDRMRQTMNDIRRAYLHDEGSFYLCGPTWPVPDVTAVLQEAVEIDAKTKKGTKKVDSRKEIEKLKDANRFVLEVY